jgi:hypothetical protein
VFIVLLDVLVDPENHGSAPRVQAAGLLEQDGAAGDGPISR